MTEQLLDRETVTRNDAPQIFDVGARIPLGTIPKMMHAWTIRRDRHGEPMNAFVREIVPVPEIGDDDVLVLVMAAGVNYNGVWAAMGQPFSVLDLHKDPYHIAGSDASGIVWAVGRNVRRWKVGDEVVAHCSQVDGDDEECNGGDPMLSPTQRIWGYETSHGSFAQFARVQATQLLPRPEHLTWAESACYTLTLATAYRMLFGHRPHVLGPGQSVLIWGAAGGLGTMAIQLAALAGAKPVAVVSDESRAQYVRSLGACGVINRSEFKCWGSPPSMTSPEYADYIDAVRSFGKAVWKACGEKRDVDMVFEHPGRNTFPVSCFVVKRGGMVVFCAATSGYDLTCDARYVWMRQKRIQGSHFASLKQAAEANRLVISGKIDPCLSEVFTWDELPQAHQKMRLNEHAPGNMAVLVNAQSKETGRQITLPHGKR
ncbi:crotonyl-CoA carboxylase/reductase [Burkholderia sp. WSM2232]|uniref:crotonyl-CoA carboxylase/reductase n=1 Tax=Burkholderia sp. WSM2232 TaxID=944436 RepID=UPI000410EB0C|nr:crotonyl-CoA carboxylase/reductase [Burkholderia sp. WSM2232]